MNKSIFFYIYLHLWIYLCLSTYSISVYFCLSPYPSVSISISRRTEQLPSCLPALDTRFLAPPLCSPETPPHTSTSPAALQHGPHSSRHPARWFLPFCFPPPPSCSSGWNASRPGEVLSLAAPGPPERRRIWRKTPSGPECGPGGPLCCRNPEGSPPRGTPWTPSNGPGLDSRSNFWVEWSLQLKMSNSEYRTVLWPEMGKVLTFCMNVKLHFIYFCFIYLFFYILSFRYQMAPPKAITAVVNLSESHKFSVSYRIIKYENKYIYFFISI